MLALTFAFGNNGMAMDARVREVVFLCLFAFRGKKRSSDVVMK